MSTIPAMSDLTVFLAETIAWCSSRASTSNPRDSLRTPELWPPNLSRTANRYGHFDYIWRTVEKNQAVVSHLAFRRAEQLRAENRYTRVLPPDLAGGRLLIVEPEESDWCCLSEPETDGFIDALDIPAWDTWVCYAHEPTTPDPENARRTQASYRTQYNKEGRDDFVDWQPRTSVSYILCWVPKEFVGLVEMGIWVNPVQCLYWAADYARHDCCTELLRRLDAMGLLR
jgi:hypothetical protein